MALIKQNEPGVESEPSSETDLAKQMFCYGYYAYENGDCLFAIFKAHPCCTIPRMPPTLCHIALSGLLALSQVACQSVPDGAMREVVPVYGLLSDAVAVASGRFGAVPVALLAENQIELVQPAWCERLAVAVKLGDDRMAWVPWDTLPQRLKNSVLCAPMAS